LKVLNGKILYSIENFYKRHTILCFWSMLILFVLPISFIKIYDIDIWWHMQCGKSILSNFSPPDFSTFYFTPVVDTVGSLRYTSLGDIIFHLVYLFSGDFGLQMMRLCAVLSACILFRSFAGKEYKPWHLLLLMVFVVGTYQKQLIRNSLYAYYLVPVVFWIWHNIRYKQKQWYIWLYPVVLGLWSCLHGSYLLGFCLVVLIFLGDIMDKIRIKKDKITKQILVYSIVLGLCFGVIAIWNPTTMSYLGLLKISRDVNHEKINPDANKKKAPGLKELLLTTTDFMPVEKKETGFFNSIKNSLNNTVFKTSHLIFVSADFVSPFDKLNRFYVWIALFSGVLGLFFILFFIRPVRFSLFLPFAGVLFVGLGYLRLCGYIPFLTAVVIFSAAGDMNIKTIKIKGKYISNTAWMLSALLILLLWCDCFLKFPVKIGGDFHSFGLGRAPIFSEKCPGKVYSEFKTNKVFTTMTTGGYLLYQWFPCKKVFIDGYFAPHPPKVRLHLGLMKQPETNPDFLFTEYGIDVALVDNASGSILNVLFNSKNWYVKYIDKGMVCFVYHPDFLSDIKIPEVLFDYGDIDSLSHRFAAAAAGSLHTIINALCKKGRFKDAEEFIKKNTRLLKKTKPLVDPVFISVTELLRLNGRKVYGLKNTQIGFYEYKHNEAIERGNIKNIIKYGLKVLKRKPDRYPIIMNLAITYFKMGKINACIEMLDRFTENLKKSTPYMNDNKTKIAKLYWGLSKFARQKNKYLKAYSLARKTSIIVPGLISSDKFYQVFIKDVAKLNSRHREKTALSLLKAMGGQFNDSARWLNDMAWQILITEKGSEPDLMQAAEYSKKAIKLMEKGNSKALDLAYDTMAVINFRRNKKHSACMYIKKALAIAPDNRKSKYKNRMECKK